MTSIDTRIEQATNPAESSASPDATTLALWSAGVLMETLVLFGGMLWILSDTGSIGVTGRVLIVTAAAILGGGAFVAAASKWKS